MRTDGRLTERGMKPHNSRTSGKWKSKRQLRRAAAKRAAKAAKVKS